MFLFPLEESARTTSSETLPGDRLAGARVLHARVRRDLRASELLSVRDVRIPAGKYLILGFLSRLVPLCLVRKTSLAGHNTHYCNHLDDTHTSTRGSGWTGERATSNGCPGNASRLF